MTIAWKIIYQIGIIYWYLYYLYWYELFIGIIIWYGQCIWIAANLTGSVGIRCFRATSPPFGDGFNDGFNDGNATFTNQKFSGKVAFFHAFSPDLFRHIPLESAIFPFCPSDDATCTNCPPDVSRWYLQHWRKPGPCKPRTNSVPWEDGFPLRMGYFQGQPVSLLEDIM